jgi:glycogen phosphorylase
VEVRAWEYPVKGVTGHVVPVYLLDTDVEGNEEEDRRITDHLYGGDSRYRLLQETVLGLGGVAVLHALGHEEIETYHLNEGHSAFLALALLEGGLGPAGDADGSAMDDVVEAVRRRCVFTTHTPVPAGHDRFPRDLVRSVLGEDRAGLLEAAGCVADGTVNMTRVALRFSRFTNGVAMRHGQVSREMFPEHRIHAITNGVHAVTWTGDGFRELFDEALPGWRRNAFLLRQAVSLPLDDLRRAHRRSKTLLLEEVERRTGHRLSADTFTVAFARRAAPYKRADLLVWDPARLRQIAERAGRLQILYAGKAHPRDQPGKDMIRRVVESAGELGDEVPLVYLEDYDMELGRLLASGADLWLNNPRKPLEASGTSGMKAALNGVPCLSVLDGWWVEGHVEGVTGWSIGGSWREASDREEEEARELLEKLEGTVLPLFYGDPDGWARVMRGAVALNGSYFHTRRMMDEYLARAYRPGPEGGGT